MSIAKTFHFVINDPKWQTLDFNLRQHTMDAVIATLTEIGFLEVFDKFEATLNLSGNHELQQLNNDFMGKNNPTNVLSFPSYEFSNQQWSKISPLENPIYLGDIAISYQKIEAEAFEQNKSFKNHYTHLIVHGILHLLGFDHENDEDAEAMESLEIKILHKLSITNPYLTILED